MATDPSWLYSTIAQSSAAIVAIIGGFITASVLSLAAEKRSLTNQLKDRKARIEGLKNHGGIMVMRVDSESVRNIEVASLEKEIASLEDRLKIFSYPPNLGWGIGVLGFLAVFGILLPTLILANEVFFSWGKLLTLTTFWLGIFAVFFYIVFQIWTLKK